MFFIELPRELWWLIISKLEEIRDLIRCMGVCHDWRSIIRDSRLCWQSIRLSKHDSRMIYYRCISNPYLKTLLFKRLGNVHTIDLSGYRSVQDVSFLGNVHTLNLAWCPNVADISHLGGVRHLDLSLCSKISDVSYLHNLHTVNLSWCGNIADVNPLRKVHTLALRGCGKVTDVRALSNVTNLDIALTSVSDVSMLGKVKRLNLMGCRMITDISALCNVPELIIVNCVNLTEVGELRKAQIKLKACDYVKRKHKLENAAIVYQTFML